MPFSRRRWGSVPESTVDHTPAGPTLPAPTWVKLRRWLLVLVLAAAAVEWFGVPHLRGSYRYRGPASDPTILDATYWSVTGQRHVSYAQMGDTMPVVAFLPLETSLVDRGRGALSAAWAAAADQLRPFTS